jgi:hypothetical protein
LRVTERREGITVPAAARGAAVNEYVVTLVDGSGQRELALLAATAAAAREAAEELHDAEVVAVRFVRALSASCRIRDGRPAR